MNQDEKVQQLADLMNELDVYIWQGVVFIGDSTKQHGTYVFPGGNPEAVGWVVINK